MAAVSDIVIQHDLFADVMLPMKPVTDYDFLAYDRLSTHTPTATNLLNFHRRQSWFSRKHFALLPVRDHWGSRNDAMTENCMDLAYFCFSCSASIHVVSSSSCSIPDKTLFLEGDWFHCNLMETKNISWKIAQLIIEENVFTWNAVVKFF